MTSEEFKHDYDLAELKVVVPHKRDFEMLVTPRFVSVYGDSAFEGFTADLLLNLAQESALFIDIGAHYGFYTLLVGTRQGSCRIIAFEPVPENYEVLRRNVELNNLRNVELHNLALSDASEAREMNVAEASDSCGFYEHPLAKSIKEIQVDAVALDDFVEGVPKGAITLKVDVEGHELHVLEGMSRTLREADDVRLFMEFNPKCLMQAGHQPGDLLGMIDGLGLDVYFIDDNHRRAYRLAGDDLKNWDDFVGDQGYANILCRSKGQSVSVCFFSHSSSLAGAERSLLQLITELTRDHGAICSVVLPHHGPLEGTLQEVGAVTLTADYSWWCDLSRPQDAELWSRLDNSLIALLQEMEEIGRINPDVVVTNTMVIPWGAVAASFLGKPHAWFIHESGRGLKFYLPLQSIMGFIMDSSNLILVNSNTLRNELFSNASDERVHIVPYHIPVPQSALDEDVGDHFTRAHATRLIITGTVMESKGQEDAILAVKELVQRGKNVELLVLGPSPGWYLRELREIVSQENLDGYIKFLGFRDNVYPIVSQADIVLVCSRYEAFGRVTLEAMLLKKPVIGTNVGGTRELITDGFNGLLYEPGDYKQLADRIEYLVEHSEKIHEFGENGYQFAQAEFTKERYGGKAYGLLKRLRGTASPFSSPFFHLVTRLFSSSIRDVSDAAARLEGRLVDKQQAMEALSAQVEEKERAIETLSAELEEKEEGIRALSAQLAEKQQEVEAFSARLAEKQQDVEALSAQVEEKERAIETLSAELEEKEEGIRALSAQLAEKQQDVEALSAQAEEKERAIQTLSAELEEKDHTIKALSVQAARGAHVASERDALQWQVDAILTSKTWRIASKGLRLYQIAEAAARRLAELRGPSSPGPGADASSNRTSAARGVRPADDSSAPKVLFISHDAHRTGAPVLLLHLLRWLKSERAIPFEVLLRDGEGELRPEFEALAPVTVWNDGPPAQAKGRLEQANIGLIYSNTITNGEVLAALVDFKCPVICHVHELTYWMRYRVEPESLRHVRECTTHYIAVSQAVKRSLIENLKVPEDRIDVVYEFVPREPSVRTMHDRIRRELHIPPDARVVGACGTTDWRKGPDLLIQLARAIHQREPENQVHFVWVGGESEGPVHGALWHDVRHANLEPCVHFVGRRTNPLEYFATFDVFALVSREDPFPLVILEAASLGKPIVCFDRSGGAREFVEDGCGLVVPYLDIETMADRVLELLSSPELRQRLGQQAAQKVRQGHDVTVVAPQIVRVIERFLDESAETELGWGQDV